MLNFDPIFNLLIIAAVSVLGPLVAFALVALLLRQSPIRVSIPDDRLSPIFAALPLFVFGFVYFNHYDGLPGGLMAGSVSALTVYLMWHKLFQEEGDS